MPPYLLQEGEVYMGRGVGPLGRSPWYTPFKVEEAGREAALASLRRLLETEPERFKPLWAGISGRVLRCHCGPQQRCHGDVIVEHWAKAMQQQAESPEEESVLYGFGDPRAIELPGKRVSFHDGAGLPSLGRWPVASRRYIEGGSSDQPSDLSPAGLRA